MFPSTLVLILLFALAIATAMLARQKGRDPYIWFAIGAFFGILGFILLMILPDASDTEKQVQNAQKQPSLIIEAAPDTTHPHHEFLLKEWYYVDLNKQQAGPVSFDQLQALWQQQQVTSLTFVWGEGMQAWQQLQNLPEILRTLQGIRTS